MNFDSCSTCVQRTPHEVAAPQKSTSAIIRLSDAFTITLECSAGQCVLAVIVPFQIVTLPKSGCQTTLEHELALKNAHPICEEVGL